MSVTSLLPVSLPSRGGPVLSAPWRRGSTRATTAFVSHTVFGYDRWRDLPAIGRDAERAARLWARQPGTLWLRQWVQPGRRLMGDLSLWRDEADLRTFLALPEHGELVSTWHGRMHGTHLSWTVAAIDLHQVWASAGLANRAQPAISTT